jgi:uncharacterized protein YbjT (DUF2867 family)
MTNPYSVTLFGASGLVGQSLVKQLVENPNCSKIQIPFRTQPSFQHPKIIYMPFSFDEQAYSLLMPTDVVICAIGTTMKKVQGNEEAYRDVDFQIAQRTSIWSKKNGIHHYMLISAIGADSNSSNFYLRLKGETEQAVLENDLAKTTIFRPSLLIGERNERRLTEGVGQAILPLFSFLLPKKYRPIKAEHLAKLMIQTIELQNEKTIIWQNGLY